MDVSCILVVEWCSTMVAMGMLISSILFDAHVLHQEIEGPVGATTPFAVEQDHIGAVGLVGRQFAGKSPVDC